MPEFDITCLEPAQIDRALPLLRLTDAGKSPQQWRDQAAAAMKDGGGMIAISAEDGLVHGLALFHPPRASPLGNVLQVDELIAIEISRKAPVRRMLLKALSQMAARLDCISLAMPAQQGFAASPP